MNIIKELFLFFLFLQNPKNEEFFSSGHYLLLLVKYVERSIKATQKYRVLNQNLLLSHE